MQNRLFISIYPFYKRVEGRELIHPEKLLSKGVVNKLIQKWVFPLSAINGGTIQGLYIMDNRDIVVKINERHWKIRIHQI